MKKEIEDWLETLIAEIVCEIVEEMLRIQPQDVEQN